MQSLFQEYAEFIDKRDEIRENIIKGARDITKASKKVIFFLHRLQDEDSECMLEQANLKLEQVRAMFKPLAIELSDPSDFYRYQRSLSGCIQEYIEAHSFHTYLSTGTLVTFTEIQEIFKAEIAQGFDISVYDYILGISDLSGELMRLVNGNTLSLCRMNEVYEFMRELEGEMKGLRWDNKQLSEKMKIMAACVGKVEKTVYKRYIREQEFPGTEECN